MDGEAERLEFVKEHPGWHAWRNGRLVYARWMGTSPPAVLWDATYEGLGKRIEVYVDVYMRTRLFLEATAAARNLET